MVMLHIDLKHVKGIMKSSRQQHGSKYFARRHPSPNDPRGMGSKGQNLTFSEHGHVVYQIKGNHEFSNMEAYILHVDPPLPQDPRLGSKDQN